MCTVILRCAMIARFNPDYMKNIYRCYSDVVSNTAISMHLFYSKMPHQPCSII